MCVLLTVQLSVAIDTQNIYFFFCICTLEVLRVVDIWYHSHIVYVAKFLDKSLNLTKILLSIDAFQHGTHKLPFNLSGMNTVQHLCWFPKEYSSMYVFLTHM